MKKFYIVALFVTSLLMFQSASAIMAPPSKLTQTRVEPACLIIGASFLGNQPANWGTGAKGPAIELSNQCEYDLVIKSVLTTLSVETAPTLFEDVDASITEPIQESFGFKLNTKGKPCEKFTSENDKDAQACSSVLLREGASLTYPMYWGYFYSIRGSSRSSSETKVLVEGQMLKRENLSVEPPDSSKNIPADLLAAANAGDKDAQKTIGAMYEIGSGVNQNTSEALWWYRKVADAGDTAMQFKVGKHFLDWADDEKGAGYLHKAAVKNHALAQIYLGVLYAKGKGVEQDYEKSYFWISHGKRHGGRSFPSADAYLQESKSHLSSEKITSLDKQVEIEMVK